MELHFEESFFEPETRDGFYITSMMKRAWAQQLEMLKVIDDICKRHDIHWYAEWGTLLGAVRHQGFVPWDDDIDIGMLRDDYEKFMVIAPKELPAPMELITTSGEANFKRLLSRVISGRSMAVDPEFLEKNHGFPYVYGVDIFPQDYLTRNKGDRDDQVNLLKAAYLLAEIWNNPETPQKDKDECLVQLLHVTGTTLPDNMTIEQALYVLSDRICGMHTNRESDYVTYIAKYANNEEYKLPKYIFRDLIEVPFECTTVMVPREMITMVSRRYRNWNQLVNQRSSHDYPFYGGQEELLRQAYQNAGIAFPKAFEE